MFTCLFLPFFFLPSLSFCYRKTNREWVPGERRSQSVRFRKNFRWESRQREKKREKYFAPWLSLSSEKKGFITRLPSCYFLPSDLRNTFACCCSSCPTDGQYLRSCRCGSLYSFSEEDVGESSESSSAQTKKTTFICSCDSCSLTILVNLETWCLCQRIPLEIHRRKRLKFPSDHHLILYLFLPLFFDASADYFFPRSWRTEGREKGSPIPSSTSCLNRYTCCHRRTGVTMKRYSGEGRRKQEEEVYQWHKRVKEQRV